MLKKYIGETSSSMDGNESMFKNKIYKCEALKFEDYPFLKNDKISFENVSNKYWKIIINQDVFIVPKNLFNGV